MKKILWFLTRTLLVMSIGAGGLLFYQSDATVADVLDYAKHAGEDKPLVEKSAK